MTVEELVDLACDFQMDRCDLMENIRSGFFGVDEDDGPELDDDMKTLATRTAHAAHQLMAVVEAYNEAQRSIVK